jgi:EAL domain-containing protein (putative c-di-GMP-specific phosphodiesterase class I)
MPLEKRGGDYSIPKKEALVETILSRVSSISQKILLSSGETLETVQPVINHKPLRPEEKQMMQDFHQTFGLFQKSFLHACGLSETTQSSIVVQVTTQDLNQDTFGEFLESARERLWQGTRRVILELWKDDTGILTYKARKNIELLQTYGYGFAICDFVERDGFVDTQFLQKLVKKITPKFVHISQHIMNGIRKWILKLTTSAELLLTELRQNGVQIFFSDHSNALQWNHTSHVLDRNSQTLLEGAEIQNEGIIDMNGGVRGSEWLVRFKNCSVIDGLNHLKHTNNTLYLVEKCLEHSMTRINKGSRRTINVYLHDLWNIHFRQSIEKYTHTLDVSCRSLLVFEILEEKYGVLNSQVLDNLKWLKKQWFQIAIDDLYVSKNNPDGLSHEILDILIEEGIQIDYIKIDGRHAERIHNNTIQSCELQKLQKLICQGFSSQSGFVYRPQYIIEWIQNRAHARMIQETLGRDLQGEFWFQGRNISLQEFQE